MASNDRYVQPNREGGWDVIKEGHRRATAHAETRSKAVTAARTMTRRDGGGEVRILNSAGKLIESRSVPKLAPARRKAA